MPLPNNKILLIALLPFVATFEAALSQATHECTLPVCVLPSEDALCKVGWLKVCESVVCYDSNSICKGLSAEEKGFFAICSLFMFTQYLANCRGEISKRDCTADCYEGNAIDVAAPVRGRCEPGGCCNPTLPLCELERYYSFMSLGYGVSTKGHGYQPCNSSLDYLGPDHGCEFLTDGLSNDAIVCDNAGITHDEKDSNYCNITFSGNNDAIDLFVEATRFSPAQATEQVYGEGESSISFTPFEMFRHIAEGDPESESDGILDIVFNAAFKKGCFTREGAAVHMIGHSLATSLANLLALKIAAHYPEVHVKMTTIGEPATFAEPLEGLAANISAWSNKAIYINGRVLPRSEIYNGFSPRPYGLYQDYDPIPQLVPGGYRGENNQTKTFFMCEVMEGNKLVYFIAGPEGCADGLSDVQNDFPSFPHAGGLNSSTSDAVGDFLNIILAIADVDLVEDFLQVVDLHMMRRSMHWLGKLYKDGQDCSANHTVINLPDI